MGCLTIETWLLFITNVFGLSLYFLYFCLYHLECYFMKEIKLETKIRIYSLAELPEEESRLMEAAIKATGQSYAPYSKFHVGAAALLEDAAKSEAPRGRSRNTAPARDEDPGLMLISRRPPQQKFTNFEEYMTAHGGATAPIEDHTDET